MGDCSCLVFSELEMINTTLTVAGSSRRGAITFGCLLMLSFFIIGFLYDHSTPYHATPTSRVGYCDGHPIHMKSGFLCPNGIHPQSGFKVWLGRMLIKYPLLVPTLNILELELPIIAAGLITYSYYYTRR